MTRRGKPRKSDVGRIFTFGLGFMITAYLLDSLIDSVVQRENIYQQIFLPDPKEIAVRIGFSSVLLLFIIYGSALLLKRRRLEEALVKYQAGMDASIDGISILNGNYECVYLNSSHAKLYGYDSYKELIGKSLRLSFPDDELRRLETEIFSVVFQKREWRGEAVGKKKDGTLFPLELSLSTIDDNSIVCIIRDITDRKNSETELERRAQELSATNKEFEAFSYSLTHDMRNYLTQIYAAAQILQDNHMTTLDDNDRHLAQIICKSTQNMEELIKDMLVLSGIIQREIRREKVDLGEIARQLAAELLLTELGRSVELACSPDLVAQCDPHLLKIALYNLFGNAWKYTRNVPKARIEFGMVENDGKKAFFVSDNGTGFDMSDAGRLFEPFQRLPNADGFPGTGIGLATVQRIIQRHGGEVWGEGESGKGAIFYFTLPA